MTPVTFSQPRLFLSPARWQKCLSGAGNGLYTGLATHGNHMSYRINGTGSGTIRRVWPNAYHTVLASYSDKSYPLRLTLILCIASDQPSRDSTVPTNTFNKIYFFNDRSICL